MCMWTWFPIYGEKLRLILKLIWTNSWTNIDRLSIHIHKQTDVYVKVKGES
jgi:hypothetical protein